MKKLLILSILFAILFSGCAKNKPRYELIKYKESKVVLFWNEEDKTLRGKIMFTEEDMKNLSIRTKQEYLFKAVALKLKEKGYSNFILMNKRDNSISKYNKSNKVPFILTDFNSLMEYCYPTEAGLQQKKCRINYPNLKFQAINQTLSVPTWKVKDFDSFKTLRNIQNVQTLEQFKKATKFVKLRDRN